MAIKFRAVYFGDKKMRTLAESVSDGAEKKADVIPPAYNVEKVRLLVICIKAAKSYNDTIMRFFGALDKSRADNVAFIIEGPEGSGQNVIDTVKNDGGANVVPNIMYVKGGLFASASPDEIAAAKEWFDGIVKSITG